MKTNFSTSYSYLTLIFFLCIVEMPTIAQKVLLDKGLLAGELQVFPDYQDPNTYYYVLNKAQISPKANGEPEVSFIQYVYDEGNNAAKPGDAGGLFHATLVLNVSDRQRQEAQSALQGLVPGATLKGPIMWKTGKVALVTALEDEEGNFITTVAGLGDAPILDGNKTAVSILLSQKGAKLLEASLKSSTPAIAFNFVMQLDGYSSPKQVKIEADFQQVYSHQTMEMAAVTPVMATEINQAFEELESEGAIKVTQYGEDDDLEAAMQSAYDKLTKLMFEQSTPTSAEIAGSETQSMLDRVSGMLANARKEAREEREFIIKEFVKAPENRDPEDDTDYEAINYWLSVMYAESDSDAKSEPSENRNLQDAVEIPELAVGFSYRLTEKRRSDTYTIDLNKYSLETRTFPFAENLPSLADCKACMLNVQLASLMDKNRLIYAKLDGANAADFNGYINYVTVQIRKQHPNGETSLNELTIDRSEFNQSGNNFKLSYVWNGEVNADAFNQYQYRTNWSFFGGEEIGTDWQDRNLPDIPLFPPKRKKTVYVEMDEDYVKNNAFRMILLKVYQNGQVNEYRLNPRKDEYIASFDVITDATGQIDFEYEWTGILVGQEPVSSGRKKGKSSYLIEGM